ncbi:MAG: hypothetical protein GXO30_05195 [Epsilonproteobacteria bacterium]|nr:hypothetical protein [Campylobacterota bacterium]
MEYDFSISGVIKEGFNRTNGVKGVFVGSIVIFAIIALFLNAMLEFIFPSTNASLNSFIASFISGIFTTPIHVGIMMFGVSHARKKEIKVSDMFEYFNMAMPIVITYILMSILIYLGFLLLVIPGIYLSVSYIFAYMLVIDKGLTSWKAMELSRKTVSRHWFKFFGLSLVIGILFLLSIIPFGIGLIWTLPMAYMVYGLLYHRLFDDEDVEI